MLQEANRVKLDMEGNLKNLQKKIEDYEKDAQQFSSQIQVIGLLTLKTGYFSVNDILLTWIQLQVYNSMINREKINRM